MITRSSNIWAALPSAVSPAAFCRTHGAVILVMQHDAQSCLQTKSDFVSLLPTSLSSTITFAPPPDFGPKVRKLVAASRCKMSCTRSTGRPPDAP